MMNKTKKSRGTGYSASFWAYQQIKQRILQNQLDSRKSLDEKMFSKQFKISRTPIREALIMLEKEGLVSREGGRGFYIQQFRMKDMQDIYKFRSLVEIAASKLILSQITEDKIQSLTQIQNQLKSLIRVGDPAEILVKSFEFHTRFIEASENSMIIGAMKNCYEKIILISWSAKEMAGSVQSLKEHEEILSALRKRDLKQLEKTIHNHNVKGRDRAFGILRSNADKWYFAP
jgi:DNA-binding GntR family transcriptional regulator